ncbi:MAG: hypothetical protein ACI9QD_001023, partial [Thermoproteota archaeon]
MKKTNDAKEVIFLINKNQKSVLKQLINQMKGNHTFMFTFVESVEEAVKAIMQTSYALFLVEVQDKASLSIILPTIKKCKKVFRQEHIKFGVFNHLTNPNIENKLKKLGAGDFFDININAKSFTFKLDFWFKRLTPKKENEDSGIDMGGTLGFVGANGRPAKSPGRRKNQIVDHPALDNENDIWILENADDCKNVLRRWLIKIVGPSPYVGKWVQFPSENNQRLTFWKFIIESKSSEMLIGSEHGLWCFDGLKPDFDWKENKWIFSGGKPSLFFEDDGQDHFRFKFDNGSLILCANSLYAETKKDAITATFEKDIEVGAEAEVVAPESRGTIDATNENLGETMSGENSGDQDLGSGSMVGKSSGTDELGGNLEGEVKAADQIDSTMAGKGGGDEVASGDMNGQIEGSAEEIDKFYKGDEKAKKAAEAKKKQDASFQQDAIDGNMGGKSGFNGTASADMNGDVDGSAEQIDKYYKGNEQAKKAEEKKKKEDGVYKQDAIHSHMAGKVGVDEVASGDMNGQIEGSAEEIDKFYKGDEKAKKAAEAKKKQDA